MWPRVNYLLLLGVVFLSTQELAFGKGSPQRYNEESTDPYEDVNDSIYYKRSSAQKAEGDGYPRIPVAEFKHPLDPLTSLEMRVVYSIVSAHRPETEWQFKMIGLREPDKTLLYPYILSRATPPDSLIPRRANVLICDPVKRIPIWVIVNLSDYRVESWVESPNDTIGVITVEDNDLASQIVLSDPNIKKRVRDLGISDMRSVIPDVWDAGYVADNPNYAQAKKLVQVFFYWTKGNGTNYYAHPLDFVAYVELGQNNKVRGIENLPIHEGFDTEDRTGNSVPQREYNIFPDQLPPSAINRNLNRLKISQPDGPSFSIFGHAVNWDKYQLRLGYNPREGAHIYAITFNDKGIIRPIAYRLSMSEVFLQYGSPRPVYRRKDSFDLTNWEFGSSCFSQPVHQFCRGDAYYFAADHHNERGETWIVQNSICVFEEDAGVLWAHYDSDRNQATAARAQRLVIGSLVSIGNIDYLIHWRLYQDATIELAIKVTGLFSTNLLAIDVKAPVYGDLVAPQVYTQIYQHFFVVRADMDVDGRNNTVSTEDIVRVSESISPDNPYGNGMMAVEKVLATPAEAATDMLPSRFWKISNPGNVNPLSGKPVAWRLIPQGNPNVENLMTKDSPLRGRIPWANRNMWVTPYNPDQIFAGGKYLSDGVASWTQQNASANIVDKDVVLWHVFNYVESPTQEDWPVISGCPGTIGFRLRPDGFFSSSLAVTIPPASETTALDGRENAATCSGVGVGVTPPSAINPNLPPGWSG